MQNSHAKYCAIAVCAVCAATFCTQCECAAAPHTAFANRFLYHFFHANIFHLTINTYCFLQLVFLWHLSVYDIAIAYIISSLIPDFTLQHPTIGLSAWCFALIGIKLPRIGFRRNVLMWLTAALALPFLLPNVNATLHLYCCAMGCIYSLLTSPIWRI